MDNKTEVSPEDTGDQAPPAALHYIGLASEMISTFFLLIGLLAVLMLFAANASGKIETTPEPVHLYGNDFGGNVLIAIAGYLAESIFFILSAFFAVIAMFILRNRKSKLLLAIAIVAIGIQPLLLSLASWLGN